MTTIESEQVESNKSLLQSAQQKRAAELAGGTPNPAESDPQLDREYDKDFVDFELQMIINKNRQKMADGKNAADDNLNQLDRSDLDQDGYF